MQMVAFYTGVDVCVQIVTSYTEVDHYFAEVYYADGCQLHRK